MKWARASINQHPSFTLSLWAKVDGRRQNDLRLFSEGNTVDSNLFSIWGHTAEGLTVVWMFIFVRVVGLRLATPTEYEPLDGQWHHLAWVEHDGQRSLYVDGRLDALEIALGRWSLALDNTTLGVSACLLALVTGPSMMSPFGVVRFQG